MQVGKTVFLNGEGDNEMLSEDDLNRNVNDSIISDQFSTKQLSQKKKNTTK